MVKKIFAGSGDFWNKIVVSSADPTAVALTAKGFVSLGIVQAIFGVLPLLGFHPSFDLNGVGDQIYTVTYSVLSAVSGIVAVVGAVRKAWLYFFPAPASE